MLYLIRSFGRSKKQKYLKVGFTDNLQNRMTVYRTNNPFFELISTREGDLVLEQKIHLYLQALGLKANFLNEWFLDTPQTLSEFHTDEIKINKVIWKNRNNLFQLEDFKNLTNPGKRFIYENLRMIYMRPGMKYKTEEIDILWKREINKKYLKQNKIDKWIANDNVVFI